MPKPAESLRPLRAVTKPASLESSPPSTSPASSRPSQDGPARSPEFNRLVELRAYAIWVGQGVPTGLAGELVKEKNWKEAERQIETEVKARAFTIWVKQGRPTGAAGDAVREKNMRIAEKELLKETEDRVDSPPARLIARGGCSIPAWLANESRELRIRHGS